MSIPIFNVYDTENFPLAPSSKHLLAKQYGEAVIWFVWVLWPAQIFPSIARETQQWIFKVHFSIGS